MFSFGLMELLLILVVVGLALAVVAIGIASFKRKS